MKREDESKKAEAELGKLRKLPDNKKCANCLAPGAPALTAVVMPFRIFVCSTCKSAHQAFSHRCKSTQMSLWTLAEVRSLEEHNGGGNRAAQETWLADVRDDQRPRDGDRLEVFKDFVERAYIQERWARKASKNKRPESSNRSEAAPRVDNSTSTASGQCDKKRDVDGRSSIHGSSGHGKTQESVATVDLLFDDVVGSRAHTGHNSDKLAEQRHDDFVFDPNAKVSVGAAGSNRALSTLDSVPMHATSSADSSQNPLHDLPFDPFGCNRGSTATPQAETAFDPFGDFQAAVSPAQPPAAVPLPAGTHGMQAAAHISANSLPAPLGGIRDCGATYSGSVGCGMGGCNGCCGYGGVGGLGSCGHSGCAGHGASAGCCGAGCFQGCSGGGSLGCSGGCGTSCYGTGFGNAMGACGASAASFGYFPQGGFCGDVANYSGSCNGGQGTCGWGTMGGGPACGGCHAGGGANIASSACFGGNLAPSGGCTPAATPRLEDLKQNLQYLYSS